MGLDLGRPRTQEARSLSHQPPDAMPESESVPVNSVAPHANVPENLRSILRDHRFGRTLPSPGVRGF